MIPQPNFFGSLEEVNQLTEWAHAQQAFVIAVTNPISLALLKEPSWGKQAADIVCGEGQALGVPLAGGGPLFWFYVLQKRMATTNARQNCRSARLTKMLNQALH